MSDEVRPDQNDILRRSNKDTYLVKPPSQKVEPAIIGDVRIVNDQLFTAARERFKSKPGLKQSVEALRELKETRQSLSDVETFAGDVNRQVERRIGQESSLDGFNLDVAGVYSLFTQKGNTSATEFILQQLDNPTQPAFVENPEHIGESWDSLQYLPTHFPGNLYFEVAQRKATSVQTVKLVGQSFLPRSYNSSVVQVK